MGLINLLMTNFIEVQLVRGHNGCKGKERVDYLANQGVEL